MTPRINEEIDRALTEHHGFVQAEGADGKVIVMSMQVYREMMGVGTDEEMSASLKVIDQAMEDLAAGKSIPLAEARRRFDEKYSEQRALKRDLDAQFSDELQREALQDERRSRYQLFTEVRDAFLPGFDEGYV
jgi:hypothetical protein